MYILKRLTGIGTLALIVLLMLAACGAPAPAEPEEAMEPAMEEAEPMAEMEMSAHQAPMLAEMVAAGELPPLSERLPTEPLVQEGAEGIGKYGGTLRFGNVETGLWNLATLRTVGLFQYNQENSEVSVDIAKDFYWNDDLSQLTIVLRAGHKWSDGAPFTADDVLFKWQDVDGNEELNPSFSNFWSPGGEPVQLTKVDDMTVTMKFAVPYPAAVDLLGRSWFSADPAFMMPAHYLKEFHIEHNPDAAAQAEAEGFDDWVGYFRSHSNPSGNVLVDRPSLWVWIAEERTSERVISVRNPYFHQVDTAGNQLPYIDRVDTVITGDKQVQILKATTGEFDFEGWYLSLNEMGTLQANKEAGDFKVQTAKSLRSSEFALMPNRTVQDEVLNDLFNSFDFRRAISIGIDRDAINEVVFFGLGTAYPAIPLPSNSYVSPDWHTLHTEYDPDTANQLLDDLGLSGRDGDGYRLRPDGDRLSVIIEIGSAEGPKLPICEIIQQQWVSIGIEVTCKVTEGSLYTQRNIANEFEIATWHLDRSGLFGRANPLWYGFLSASQQRWGAQWVIWFNSDGTEGIEPPDEIKELRALFAAWQQTEIGSDAFVELGTEYYRYFAEQLPMIGTVGLGPVPQVVSNRLHNVPSENIWWGSDTNFYAPYKPGTWYIEE
jgi:peptide/nickel transport system substrate-binding protein